MTDEILDLQQSDFDLLQEVADHVPGVIFQFRMYPDGRFCFPYASGAIREIYEVTPDQVREDASAMHAILHPEDHDEVVASIMESARTLRPWRHEFRVVLPRQGLQWRQGNSRPKKLADGSILWHGFITDITERKQMEQSQRMNELRSAMLLEFHKRVRFWTDPETYAYAINMAVCFTDSTSGCLWLIRDGQDAVLLAEWDRWNVSHGARDPADESRQAIAAAETWGDCVRLMKPVMRNAMQAAADWKAGREKPSELLRSLSLPVLEGDKVRLAIVVGDKERDYDQHDVMHLQLVADELHKIIEYKKAEEALKGSEARYRRLIGATTDYIFTVSMENGQAVATAHGPGCEKITGYSIEDFQADENLWYRMIHPDDREAVLEQAARVMQGETTEALEHRIFHKNGTLRWLRSVKVATKDKGGNVIAYDGCNSDISERKQAELSLVQTAGELQLLSSVNKILVRATDEVRLLEDMCRALAIFGNHRMVWVGYAGLDGRQPIVPAAVYDRQDKSLNALSFDFSGLVGEDCPMSHAIRLGATQARQDLRLDAHAGPWRDEALGRGYASCIALPLADGQRIFGGVSVYSHRANVFDPSRIALMEEIAGDIAFGIANLSTRRERDQALMDNQSHVVRLTQNLEETIQAIAATVEMRDPYTAGHQKRVADLAAAIAVEMGLPDDAIHGLHLAGTVHDLGKIRVPAEILSKPGILTELEFMLIKTHAMAGHDILKGIQFPWPIAQVVLQHHERLDGSGYPNGLQGDEISIEACILAVADVVEAMASHRPYRAGLGMDKALEEIERNQGKYYAPAAVHACLKLFRENNYQLMLLQ